MRNLFIVLLAFLVLGAGGDTGSETINPSKFNPVAMKKALLVSTNKYRKSNGAGELRPDKNLEMAAQDQADYIGKTGKLTHDQPSANKKGPKERIRFHGGKVSAYAENISMLLVQKPCSVYNARGQTEIKTLRTYEEVADAMVHSWNVSKGHRKNLQSESYGRTGFGVTYDAKSRKVTAVQVFGD